MQMNRRKFMSLTCGAAAGALASTIAPRAMAQPKSPNFIVIMADDMGAKELGCYGHPKHNTPNLDQLAETGVRFETCFATPLCHPTRFEIMTGQYGCHNGVYNFAGRRGGPEPDSPGDDMGERQVTFAEVLKEKGYATAQCGKWQLSGKLPTLVRDCGFDEYCMWAYRHNLPEDVDYKGGMENGTKAARFWNPSILKNGEYIPTTPEDYGPDMFTDFLIDFIKRHKDAPFFAYYPMCLTHAPHIPTPDSIQPGDERFTGGNENFQAVVEYTDKLVGRIVKALDEFGLRENTILFFTGDNGTGGQGKGQPTELGARVPMIVNSPGIVKPRGGTEELTDLSDILPTLVDFAGAMPPQGRTIDGKSYAPFLRGERETTREWIFSYIADRRILRTKRWLLEDNSPLHYGKLYDCGQSRDGTGYKDVTNSDAPGVAAIKERFNKLLEALPAPHIAEEGPAAGKKGARAVKKALRKPGKGQAKGGNKKEK